MATETMRTEGAAGHSAFPPFQPEYFPSQLGSLAVCFILLYGLMTKIALPRIDMILRARRQRLTDDLTAAQRFRNESYTANAAHLKSLADARERAQNLVSAMGAMQVVEAEAARKRIEIDLSRRFAAADQSIDATRSSAMKNVEAIASDVATAIVARLSRRSTTD